MKRFNEYLNEINDRKIQGLNPKPIDNRGLLNEIISNILDSNSKCYSQSLNLFIYNVLPGTTSAAEVKSNFLKKIILGKHRIKRFLLILLLSYYLIWKVGHLLKYYLI